MAGGPAAARRLTGWGSRPLPRRTCSVIVPFALIATVSAVFAHVMSRYNQRLLVEDILRLPAESPLRGITAELYGAGPAERGWVPADVERG